MANVIYPWSQLTVPDSNFNASNGFPPRKVYVEAVDYLPGLAGESRDFDANGPYIRTREPGGMLNYSLQPGMFGQALTKLDAVQPEVPPGGKRPPYKETVPCETQQPITNLATPTSGPIQQTNTSSSPASKARWARCREPATRSPPWRRPPARRGSSSTRRTCRAVRQSRARAPAPAPARAARAARAAVRAAVRAARAAGGSGGPLSGAPNSVGQATREC